MEKKQKKKNIGALDIFIILIFAVCVVSVGLRFISNRNSELGENAALDNYKLSFMILDIQEASTAYLTPGEKLYLYDEAENPIYLGTISDGNITIKNAHSYFDANDGSTVIVENPGSGSFYRVDVEGSIDVKGRIDEDGNFLLNGNEYVGVNKYLYTHSKYLSVSMLVTDITKE